MQRAGCEPVDFETALRHGWPGDYGSESEIANVLEVNALESARGGAPFPDGGPEMIRVMHLLAEGLGIDLARLIDSGAVVARGGPRWGPNPEYFIQNRVPTAVDLKPDRGTDPASLINWTLALGPAAIARFLPALQTRLPDQYAGVMALGVRDAIERWLLRAHHHPEFFREAGRPLADATRPYFEALDARVSKAGSDASPPLRRAWLWFAWCCFTASPDGWSELSEVDRSRLLRAASEDLARVRKLLGRAQPRPLIGADRERVERIRWKRGGSLPPLTEGDRCQGHGCLLPLEYAIVPEETHRAAWEEFEWEKDHLKVCIMLLVEFGGLWMAIKPMLLAWRSLAAPAVAPDLRYWDEPDEAFEPPPRTWSELVAWPINLFHAFAGREEGIDPSFERLRGELANFCLDRLADRWTKKERDEAVRSGRVRCDADMVEVNAHWRYCVIRAASSLGINPEGKGHRVLRFSADVDPDDRVRDAAHQAYEQMRRGVGLHDGVSPRRAIMTAFWWLRQAHLLGLGIQPDADGAQRTRAKEVTRTRDAEQPISRPATNED
jgi:hypothetical protein